LRIGREELDESAAIGREGKVVFGWTPDPGRRQGASPVIGIGPSPHAPGDEAIPYEEEFTMQRTVRAFTATALVAAFGATAAPALAAPTESAVLECGSKSYIVNGFGRGQVLHVVGSTSNFIVTRRC
jgi:hypothetical protein